MVMSEIDRERFVSQIRQKVEIAKTALQEIVEIADGKDENVVLLALYRIKELDTIVKCAEINK